MAGAGSYSVAHRAGLLPTELTGMWGWILLRSPHRGRGSLPAPAPTKQRPVRDSAAALRCVSSPGGVLQRRSIGRTGTGSLARPPGDRTHTL